MAMRDVVWYDGPGRAEMSAKRESGPRARAHYGKTTKCSEYPRANGI